MKKLICLIISLLFCASAGFAAVDLPEFAFTGQEITGFSIRPSFRHVTVSFSVQSSVDSYLRQESFKLKDVETKKYSSADPGGMYSGGFGTALSYVFVGERAYRNNVVKGYLDKQYLDVINSYEKYYDKRIKGTKFEEEVNLLYAFSLMETGAISNAVSILKKIASGSGDFRSVASDRVAAYYTETKSYEEMDIFASGLSSMAPFTLYSWLYSLSQLERYDRIIDAYGKNSAITSKDPRFFDFNVSAAYSLGRFEDVAAAKDRATENTAGVIADACVVRSDTGCAREMFDRIGNPEMKKVIAGKIAVAEKNTDKAEEVLKSMNSDEDRLNLFFFYIGKNFPDISLDFIDSFRFDSTINNDYIKFYKGVYYLSKKDYMNAVRYIDGVVFNRELINTAYYYRGLAYASVDASRAQRYLFKFIELSEDKQKQTVSRYMLSQLYYLDRRYDDALMLIQPCGEDFCGLLKARIYLAKNDPDNAWKSIADIKGDEAALLRATVLYNSKKFNDAIAQLKTIKTKNTESDLLMMLTLLKKGSTRDAGEIFNRHSADSRFMNAYVENLFLTGQYLEVLKLTDRDRDGYALVRAKALFSLGRTKDSAVEFRKIIDGGQNSFDAWYGLLSSYMAMGDKDRFTDAAKEVSGSRALFDKKDFLILQTAKMALDNKDTRLATMMLNSFFDNFTVSVYMRDAHLLRGQLFRDTGRVEQCLADAEVMMKDGRSDEASFLKAECLQSARPKDALKIFEELAVGSDRFRDLSYGKLIDIYTRPADVRKAAVYFKDKDTGLFYGGLEKYFGMIDQDGLSKESAFIDALIKEGAPTGLPILYYYKGRIAFNEKRYEDAATDYMKGYYLFPSSEYASKSLSGAADSYDKLGKGNEGDIVRAKLKELKRRK